MAKFRKARRYARKAYGKFKRYAKRESISATEGALGGAAYGVVRPMVANLVPDLPQLGGYSDNILLGGAGAIAAWKGKGLVKKIGLVMLVNETFVASTKASSGIISQPSSGGIFIN